MLREQKKSYAKAASGTVSLERIVDVEADTKAAFPPSQSNVRFGGAVIVGSARELQTEPVGKIHTFPHVSGVVLAVIGFQRVQSAGNDFGEQGAEFRHGGAEQAGMRHGDQCPCVLEHRYGLLWCGKLAGHEGQPVSPQIRAEGFLAVFHRSHQAEQFREMWPPHYAASGKLGGLLVAHAEAQRTEPVGYAQIAFKALLADVGEGVFQPFHSRGIVRYPQAEKMGFAPGGSRAYLTAAHENDALFLGLVFSFVQSVERVMIGEGDDVETGGGRLAYDFARRVGAVGGIAVGVEVDAVMDHARTLARWSFLSIFGNNGVDERRRWGTLGAELFQGEAMTDAQLDILVCPNCRQDTLTVIDAQTGVVCPRCRLVYPVRDDVPILSAEAAVSADAWFTGERGLSGIAEGEGRAAQPAEVCR